MQSIMVLYKERNATTQLKSRMWWYRSGAVWYPSLASHPFMVDGWYSYHRETCIHIIILWTFLYQHIRCLLLEEEHKRTSFVLAERREKVSTDVCAPPKEVCHRNLNVNGEEFDVRQGSYNRSQVVLASNFVWCRVCAVGFIVLFGIFSGTISYIPFVPYPMLSHQDDLVHDRKFSSCYGTTSHVCMVLVLSIIYELVFHWWTLWNSPSGLF